MTGYLMIWFWQICSPRSIFNLFVFVFNMFGFTYLVLFYHKILSQIISKDDFLPRYIKSIFVSVLECFKLMQNSDLGQFEVS